MTAAVTADAYWPAPAKLNLFLHVTGRRPDGYHRLQTLFQLLDWGDEVQVEVTRGERIMRGIDIKGVDEDQDLAIRAARLLQAECRPGRGATISVHKRIPQGSGLGGASSNAATVLVALNRLWNCGLSPGRLAELGLSLGADVPVFIHGFSAVAEGVGEALRPVTLGERHYVLLMPGIHVSTADVFADPHLVRNTPLLDLSATGAADWDALQGTRNDCEAVALRRHPQLRAAAETLSAYGPARMTGSGSTFFLPVPDASEAKRVTTALETRYNARAVRGVDRSALLERLENAATGG